MATTFLTLTNGLLRRIKEVGVSSGDFATVRGTQALAKDAINASLAHIDRAESEWPWNASEHTASLVVGQTEYTFPTDLKVADWNSFQLQKNDSLGVNFRDLKYIDRDIWYRYHRDRDYDAGNTGRDSPTMVFPSHGFGFGVTPSPDQIYSLKFRYYLKHTKLTLPDDTIRIYDEHENVVLDGAVFYLYMMRQNAESAVIIRDVFDRGMRDLQTLYINNFDRVYDTRVDHPPAYSRGSSYGYFG